MDVFPKFIIEGDVMIISNITYHKQLATNIEQVKGGGWYRREGKDFILYGSSSDFGKANIDDIRKAIETENVFTNRFQTHNISNRFKFKYDTGSEIIDLN